ncbi:unnamed protein product [Parnassius apollo]|uniref:(apollo) hypothetical protein n=1 Tax=Parnassius apollo TaxID=110799 RepID=A0A8S3W4N4_PARAO|nr:unnamed protein product [Parnassius apollo]
MSVHKCCVPNCGTTRTTNITLHLFPNPDKDIDRVCHAQFERRYYTISNRLVKNANAVSTINLSGYSVRNTPLQDITNTSIHRVDDIEQGVASTSTFDANLQNVTGRTFHSSTSLPMFKGK